jgi:hypothetical protein
MCMQPLWQVSCVGAAACMQPAARKGENRALKQEGQQRGGAARTDSTLVCMVMLVRLPTTACSLSPLPGSSCVTTSTVVSFWPCA